MEKKGTSLPVPLITIFKPKKQKIQATRKKVKKQKVIITNYLSRTGISSPNLGKITSIPIFPTSFLTCSGCSVCIGIKILGSISLMTFTLYKWDTLNGFEKPAHQLPRKRILDRRYDEENPQSFIGKGSPFGSHFG